MKTVTNYGATGIYTDCKGEPKEKEQLLNMIEEEKDVHISVAEAVPER